MDYDKEIKKDKIAYIAIVPVVLTFLKFGIDELFPWNNNLGVYLLYYFCKALPVYVISGIVIFFTIIFIYWELNKEIAYKKLIKKALLISIIPFFLIETIKSPENVKIDGKHTNLLNYQYNILKDVIENKTITIKIDASNIEANNYIPYFNRNTRGRGNYTYPEIYHCYVIYNTEKYGYSSVESSYVVSIINSLIDLEDKITIEYYKNTGIIKAIDGINKTEHKKLEERVDYLEKQKNERSQNKNKDKYKYNYN
ncbi:MAG: hypothetical protein J6J36_05530 [Clostridia bacterium]|nr:hypothetical protein [Clostridia bacterium]